MPYAGSARAASRVTTAALSSIARRAESASVTSVPSRATAITSAGERPVPVSSTIDRTVFRVEPQGRTAAGKLRLRDRVQAVIYAYETGLISAAGS
jgi:hypothetical protein